MTKKLQFLLFLTVPLLGLSQEKWDLRRCIDYALQNNISIQQADIQARITKLQEEQAKLNTYPSLNFNTSGGMQFGRSIDPTTNLFTTTQLLFNSAGINAGVQIFNWGNLKNSYAAAQLSSLAAAADVQKASNDVAVNVATFYLQILAAQQQMKIVEVQIQQTQAQLSNTKSRVLAGTLPELNLAELEAQLARDSTNWVAAKTNFDQTVLQLKAVLNLDMAAPFDVDTPDISTIPLESLADLEPATLYQTALNNLPQFRAADYRLKAAQKSMLAAKSRLYPTISLGAGASTNFASPGRQITGVEVLGYQNTSAIVNVNGTTYFVQQPNVKVNQGRKSFFEMWDGYGVQMTDNFRQNFGIQISVPIFNNGSNRINYERSKLTYKQSQVAQQQANIQLQQEIYTAHNNAINALQRFEASKKAVETAQKAYDFAAKRYEAGLINTLDLITNQNNLTQRKLEMLNNQFDYVFRLKLLEFYRGNGFKL